MLACQGVSIDNAAGDRTVVSWKFALRPEGYSAREQTAVKNARANDPARRQVGTLVHATAISGHFQQ